MRERGDEMLNQTSLKKKKKFMKFGGMSDIPLSR